MRSRRLALINTGPGALSLAAGIDPDDPYSWPPRTDVDAFARRAEAAIASVARPAQRVDDAAFEEELYRELKPPHEGRRLGKLWGHNPWSLAHHLQLPVHMANVEDLQVGASSGSTVVGVLVSVPEAEPFCILGRGRNDWDTAHTLAHEIGHRLFPGWGEEAAEKFADSFLHIEPDEYPGAKATAWRKAHGG